MILHIKNFYCKDMENELKGCHNKILSKFCTDAGFLTTVEIGQYFMTKDTEEFSQFTDSVACREDTLPRDDNLSEPKGSIRGNTKIGPVLEVTTCCLQGKYGVEIRIESISKDNTHSWVRISHGLNKLVTNLNTKSRTTTSRKPQKCSSKNMRSNWMQVILQADQRPKQTTKTRFCRLFPKNSSYWGKNLDQSRIRRIFNLRLWSVEEIDPSSSSRKSTSRQWWSDWILETRRSSSESFCILSSLVRRRVEEQHGTWRRKQEKIQ